MIMQHLQLGPARPDPCDLMRHMEEKLKRADIYLQSHGYSVVCKYGQRISTNLWVAATPDLDELKWNEIFIGKLPRDMFEDSLLPYLESCGPVYKIRFMMDFSKSNRGYCFVKYGTREAAFRAINMLNGRQVAPNKPPIGVKLSFDNNCLFFGNLPPECDEQTLLKVLERAGVEGIEDIQMICNTRFVANPDLDQNHFYLSRNNPQINSYHNNQMNNINFRHPSASANRPFNNYNAGRNCHVYFVSHDAATKARRFLLPGDVKLFQRRLTIDWARSVIPEEILANLSCSST